MTEAPAAEYICTCPGYTTLMIERMCLKCLDAYSEGLPHVLKGDALAGEMRRVASCLARIVMDDPALGRVPVYVGSGN